MAVESHTSAPSHLLTVAEVAELLSLSERHVRRLAPELGGFNLGRRVRFRRERVEAWIAEREAEAGEGGRSE